jgi:hypothetical protein
MKVNNDKSKVITFTRRTSPIHYNYKLCDKCITRTDSVKDLGILLNSELLFHHHVDYIFFQSLKMLGLIRSSTYSFSTIDSLLLFYCIFLRSKLEYALTAWNNIAITDANKLESVQLKFAALTIMLAHLSY